MNLAYLERRESAANMARFYTASIVPTLFGEWALVRGWAGSARPARFGRSGSKPSKMPLLPARS